MKSFSLLFIFSIFLSGGLFGQNFVYPEFELLSVDYGGELLTIKKDNGTGSYTGIEWLAGEENQLPVAYVSGSAPVTAASFNMFCDQAPDSILVRGICPEGMTFEPVVVPVTNVEPGAYTFNYPSHEANTVFESAVVRYFDTFNIGWDVSFDSGETWRTVDTSRNTLYVTKNAPMARTGLFDWYHSVYDISCRNADMNSSETDVIAGIWSEFTDQIVLNHNSDSLHYYKPKGTYNTNLAALLKYKNAQCYTFAQLFLACIKIQGIERSNNYVYITPRTSYVCGNSVNRFLVKNWSFGAPTGTGCADFPYENTYTTLIPPPYTDYSFITEDVSDEAGLPGQCSPNPSSYFNNHQISKIDGVYYDACYGVTFDSLEDIPFEGFSGWGYRYTSGGVTHARFTNDMEITELRENITTY
ncbi:hypothetical protein [Crocinitomix catalasitica]|uniref:hypothetical protein n=1 Tax=Crocinitomix catalasitica TaxID=184607 RepID=UPI0012F89132|nr:hypothetical protein [Crocinitomix catalasitica]